MKRSMTSDSVRVQPSRASTTMSIRTAIRSVSTSTPSQSKITSERGVLTPSRASRDAPGRGSGGAAELAVIPGDGARGREAEHDALGRLLEHAGPRLGRELGAGVTRHQLQAELAHTRGIALDRHVALEHDTAQLAVDVTAGLELERGARIALEVTDLLRLAVRPGQKRVALAEIPQRHQVRPPTGPDGRARQHALLVHEAMQLGVRHRDDAAPRRHRQYPRTRSTT